jgi:ubiquinone/menaquinone biosynthesis C-methylase UbiE
MKDRRPNPDKRRPIMKPRNPGILRQPGTPTPVPRDPEAPRPRPVPTPPPARPHPAPGAKRSDVPPRPTPSSGAAGGATHWGEVADWYDQLVGESGSEYHRHVVLPGATRLLAATPADPVIDIACGQGVLCRLLARQNIPTTGVDAATDLIRLARERNNQITDPTTRPTYHTGDARDLSFLPESHFAAAACLLAIQNIHPINPVFKSVARVLRPLGRFVVVMMHPAFRNPKETHWGWDDRARVQYRRVDKYLQPRKIPITTHPGKSQDYTWTFHKPIEAYVKGARSAGLLIDALEEWPSHKTSTSGPRAPAENTARKEIPMFLALRAVKVPTDLLPTEPPAAPASPDAPADEIL